MFEVIEIVETYESGYENIAQGANVKCETYEEAREAYEERVKAHVEAGHKEIYKTDKCANYADFNGGNIAVASYMILIK